MTKVLILATPPTPNGDLHLGHLSGPYLGADIHTRYLRMRGVEAYYVTGSDDHQSYVDFKAKQTGSTAGEVASHFGDAMLKTLEAGRIEVDHYARPRQSPYHIKLVEDFIKKLYSEGHLVAREATSLFCETCQIYLYEAYVYGKCPHCRAVSGGNACEDCGRPNDCIDLLDPTCKVCGSRPGTRTFNRLYFPLARFEQQLRDYYESARMNTHLRVLCEQMLADGLPEIPISHLSNWGIPIPIPGFEDQTTYVWFEMAPGFLAATRELSEKIGANASWEDFWKDDGTKVVQFFGFDNGYFFAVLFPAIFLAYDPDIRIPAAFAMNEFYRLDGLKFSTSRNHAIWGRQMVGQVPADSVRFHLSYSGPETEMTNFTLGEFKETVRRELIDGLQFWLNGLGARIDSEFNGVTPAPGTLTGQQSLFYASLKRLFADAAPAYEAETFSPQRATRLICELAREARRFAFVEDHWKKLPNRKQERETAVALELLAAKTLALVSAPIMPDFAVQLWKDLGCETPLTWRSWGDAPEWIAPGTRVSGLDRVYFPEVSLSLPETKRASS